MKRDQQQGNVVQIDWASLTNVDVIKQLPRQGQPIDPSVGPFDLIQNDIVLPAVAQNPICQTVTKAMDMLQVLCQKGAIESH